MDRPCLEALDPNRGSRMAASRPRVRDQRGDEGRLQAQAGSEVAGTEPRETVSTGAAGPGVSGPVDAGCEGQGWASAGCGGCTGQLGGAGRSLGGSGGCR